MSKTGRETSESGESEIYRAFASPGEDQEKALRKEREEKEPYR